jgi:predicted GTPase
LDARLRVLGERERWNLDVLLRLLIDLLPEVAKLVRATCPYQMNFEEVGTSSEEKEESFFSESLIRRHLT